VVENKWDKPVQRRILPPPNLKLACFDRLTRQNAKAKDWIQKKKLVEDFRFGGWHLGWALIAGCCSSTRPGLAIAVEFHQVLWADGWLIRLTRFILAGYDNRLPLTRKTHLWRTIECQ
jgi:hypothetical protein